MSRIFCMHPAVTRPGPRSRSKSTANRKSQEGPRMRRRAGVQSSLSTGALVSRPLNSPRERGLGLFREGRESHFRIGILGVDLFRQAPCDLFRFTAELVVDGRVVFRAICRGRQPKRNGLWVGLFREIFPQHRVARGKSHLVSGREQKRLANQLAHNVSRTGREGSTRLQRNSARRPVPARRWSLIRDRMTKRSLNSQRSCTRPIGASSGRGFRGTN